MARFELGRFEHVADKAANDVLTTLAESGHKFEGELEREFRSFVKYVGKGIVISATAPAYIDELEYGIAPNEVDDEKINFDKLVRWVEAKRALGHKLPGQGKNKKASAEYIANATIRAWQKYGYELGGAIAYSARAKVVGAITDTMNKFFNDYVSDIDNQVFDYLDEEFFKTKSGKI